MDILNLLIQLVSGAAGGSIGGAMFKNVSQGTLGNVLSGIIGGGLGTQIINSMLGIANSASAANLDAGAIASQIAGSGIGGVVMTGVIGWLAKEFAPKRS